MRDLFLQFCNLLVMFFKSAFRLLFGASSLTDGERKRRQSDVTIPPCEGNLTPEEVEAVRESWAVVQKDLKGHSLKLFIHFLELYPFYQNKFPSFKDVPQSQLHTHRAVKSHAFTVGTAIGGLILNLDDTDMLVELLHRTGANHKERGLDEADFQNLNNAIFDYLRLAFGDKFTPLLQRGWSKVLKVVHDQVCIGLNST